MGRRPLKTKEQKIAEEKARQEKRRLKKEKKKAKLLELKKNKKEKKKAKKLKKKEKLKAFNELRKEKKRLKKIKKKEKLKELKELRKEKKRLKKLKKKPGYKGKKIVKESIEKEEKVIDEIFSENSLIVPKQNLKIKTSKKDIFDGVHKTRIRLFGIGGGAGNIVSEIASRIEKADFVVANTDGRALYNLPKQIKKLQFGKEMTHGLGTGMNPEIGEKAAEAEEEKIKAAIEGQDLCIIIACLGGGTSSGATPFFAKTSKDLGNLTYGIFTLPFEFEGERKMQAALVALEKIKPNVDVFSIIPNDRIFEIVDKNTPLKDALSAINKKLADNLEGLIETIYVPGLINIDFADLRAILGGKGKVAYLNTSEVETTDRDEIIKKVISSPIYPYSIKGAKGILYNINSGRNIQLGEINSISNVIYESANKNAKIIFGINQNPKFENKTRITLLATGCPAKEFALDIQPEKQETKPEEKKKSIVKKAKKIEPVKKEIIKPDPIIKEAPKKEEPKVVEEVKVIEPPKFDLPVAVPVSSKEKVSPANRPTAKWADMSGKVRKNALQVKKEVDEAEKEILDQEKMWEVPAILRKRGNNL